MSEMKNDVNPQSSVEVRILRLLIEHRRAYGAEIQRVLQKGWSVHTTLVRMADKGWIVATGWDAKPMPYSGGKRRRYYEITEAGREVEMRLRKENNR
jgi:DNA-binding PadR family transcriptional regulator